MWDTYIIIPMTNVLLFIYEIIGHNFGIAIILFTILVRAITWPLTAQQLKGTQGMQELQKDKEWLSIQKKYKNDKEKLASEQMRIYKERGINPFGSCLPTIIQFPVIIGLYQSIIRSLAATPLSLLNMSRSLYSFLDISSVIPLNSKFLWMDLGRPESIDVFGFALPTLAVIVVITSYIQSKLMTPPSNPGDQSAAMGNMMSIYMPFLMGYFAMTFASGLALYFITSNLLGIAQYAMMGRANWNNLIPGRK
ncbi:MAG: membrane protein insertase YidC [Anaerolineae bacterium]|jgi:YidC/Oxa1 family membrane protein insertase|nr:membrane protein insertase YidC [Anaerolineae bacterium]MBT4311943.1 membrane protein insertase YidC [Anaerolineae bacterium]MBT4457475.1 membrane protein insertase YidC [Anaerolineae bacterium]MBT6060392.1 membrane protein insertase YidC [Anaerolineae bacterium]MBT6321128.1 membrane protein insertase YidC [Anaerolineae bacterium]